MSTVLMTGFPGFLGSALLPRVLARRPGSTMVCVVQDRHLDTARDRLAAIEKDHPDIAGRTELVVGDITVPGLGLDADTARDIDEVFHLAAVYDLAVGLEIAQKVNVEGTANVIAFCRELSGFRRLQYVSTCYVSGRYDGEFLEDDLDVGQDFYNHYESTKFEAEKLVRAAIDDGLPATIYRPGIVVGDSSTGETQKYDGPYFVAEFLRRQRLPIAVLPSVDDTVRTSLVPRDFVIAALDELSVHDGSLGRTYALTDPEPPTARGVAEIFARHLGKRIVWLPVPLGIVRTALGDVPGLEWALGMPAETIDYFSTRTTYSAKNTVAELEGTGVECPRFADYADQLLDFMIAHPDVGSAAMV
ncbi:SDR family oxidoreductase [Gordonia sp. NPDC003424]